MQYFKETYQQGLRNVTLALLLIFGLFSLHSIWGNLLTHFEENSYQSSTSKLDYYSSIPKVISYNAAVKKQLDSSSKTQHDFAITLLNNEEIIGFDQKEKLGNQANLTSGKFRDFSEIGISCISYSSSRIKDLALICLQTVVLLH